MLRPAVRRRERRGRGGAGTCDGTRRAATRSKHLARRKAIPRGDPACRESRGSRRTHPRNKSTVAVLAPVGEQELERVNARREQGLELQLAQTTRIRRLDDLQLWLWFLSPRHDAR